MPDDSTTAMNSTVWKSLIHGMFTNHPVEKMSHALLFIQHINKGWDRDFFELRSLIRIIHRKLWSYISSFCCYILCIMLLLSHRQLQSADLQHFFFSIEVLLLSKSGKLANPKNYNIEVNCDPE